MLVFDLLRGQSSTASKIVAEAIGVDPVDVSPDHWRHIHNRLTASEEPRAYSAEQHRAFLLRRRAEP